MSGAIGAELIGLFVDDGFLAAAILVVVAVAALLAQSPVAPAWAAGFILTLALPAALAASVALGARRGRRAAKL